MSNLLLSDDRKMTYVKRGRGGKGVATGTMIAMGPSDVTVNHIFN